jgi:hypothetical protein
MRTIGTFESHTFPACASRARSHQGRPAIRAPSTYRIRYASGELLAAECFRRISSTLSSKFGCSKRLRESLKPVKTFTILKVLVLDLPAHDENGDSVGYSAQKNRGLMTRHAFGILAND